MIKQLFILLFTFSNVFAYYALMNVDIALFLIKDENNFITNTDKINNHFSFNNNTNIIMDFDKCQLNIDKLTNNLICDNSKNDIMLQIDGDYRNYFNIYTIINGFKFYLFEKNNFYSFSKEYKSEFEFIKY